MSGLSVVIIVKNRHEALCRTMHGLAAGRLLPEELIIVNMNQPPAELPTMPFPVHQVPVYHTAELPLARARNTGMAYARQQRVVFLDVDCIPAPDLLAVYDKHWQDSALLSGQVRYLPAAAAETVLNIGDLAAKSLPDPIRAGLTEIPYELFWSLNFGCHKALFARIGGFDEHFQGYGAEDTDFAFSARKAKVPVNNIPAMAYHQYHSSYSPPLNHLSDIVMNANQFYRKWQTWPMGGWLDKFEGAGVISRTDDHISLLRMPTQLELQEALKS